MSSPSRLETAGSLLAAVALVLMCGNTGKKVKVRKAKRQRRTGTARIIMTVHHGDEFRLVDLGIAKDFDEICEARHEGSDNRRLRVALRILQNTPRWWMWCDRFGETPYQQFEIQALEPFVRTREVSK